MGRAADAVRSAPATSTNSWKRALSDDVAPTSGSSAPSGCSACDQSQYAGAPSALALRPQSTCSPASFARLATSSASRGLPSPLSPLTRENPPDPALAAAGEQPPAPRRCVVERGRELVDLAVASDEEAGGASAGSRLDRAGVERRVLPQDCLLELLQLSARLDAQLLDERHPRIAVRLERLCLATRPVEREHQ